MTLAFARMAYGIAGREVIMSMFEHLSAAFGQGRPWKGARTPQVRNSAGGFVWQASPAERLARFLILGTDSGSYYASPQALTIENLGLVRECVAADGPAAVRTIVDVSTSGRAARNDAAILALAVALKTGDEATRRLAGQMVPKVCRTGTHLFQFANAVDAMGGWGRGTRRALGGWYTQDPARVAFQALKYGQRAGWSHRDLLRKCHVTPPSPAHDAVFRWIVKGFEGDVPTEAPVPALAPIVAAEQVKACVSADEVIALIEAHGLPREALTTEWLRDAKVWEALLMSGRGMPMTAMIRNLGKMTSIGLLERRSAAAEHVVARLTDRARLRKARVHPLSLLVALNTYRQGQGVRGSLTWKPVKAVTRALDRAFELAFDNIPSTGLRWQLAVDVSGSMGWPQIAGMTGITPKIGAAAMAMATARSEPNYGIRAFSHTLRRVDLSARSTLEQTIKTFGRIPMGGTDCALPMIEARKAREKVDVFVVYTDSETWFGKTHPAQALRDYRQAMGIDARLIVCGMVANAFTIADPDDRGMLDVVGFDTTAPRVMAEFAQGKL